MFEVQAEVFDVTIGRGFSVSDAISIQDRNEMELPNSVRFVSKSTMALMLLLPESPCDYSNL